MEKTDLDGTIEFLAAVAGYATAAGVLSSGLAPRFHAAMKSANTEDDDKKLFLPQAC